ncbi:rolling circle replication-associated protein [Trichothermofontia sp.]
MNYTVIVHPSGFVTGSLLGLSRHPNSEKCERAPRGSKGLTSKGKLTILDACAILSKYYPNCLSFLTWTFPPEYCDQVKANWSRLVRLLLKKLQYWLKKLRLPQHYVGVTELQKNGNPHLHLVFVGRRNRYQSWLVQPIVLDKLLFEAVQEICPECIRSRFSAAGRVEPVRGEAGGYLAKYLSKPKQAESAETDSAGWFPPSWWFCSQDLRGAVARSLVKLRLKVSCWATLHDLFVGAKGWFSLIVREELTVGWIAFVLPNRVEWITFPITRRR